MEESVLDNFVVRAVFVVLLVSVPIWIGCGVGWLLW